MIRIIHYVYAAKNTVVYRRQPKDVVKVFFKTVADSVKQVFDSKLHGEAALLMTYQSRTLVTQTTFLIYNMLDY